MEALLMSTLHFVFDGLPSHEGPRFIEVETPDGKSINAGEWRERPDGFCELVVNLAAPPLGGGDEDQGSSVADSSVQPETTVSSGKRGA